MLTQFADYPDGTAGAIDLLSPVWNTFDLLPAGRGEWLPDNDYPADCARRVERLSETRSCAAALLAVEEAVVHCGIGGKIPEVGDLAVGVDGEHVDLVDGEAGTVRP